jgi:hypothetical protein
MQHLRPKLEKRGWTYEEIRKIEESIKKGELKKTPAIRIADKFMFIVF